MVSNFWWIPVAIEVFLLILLLSFDNGVWATLSLIAFLSLVHFCSFINLKYIVVDNAEWFFSCAAIYFALGLVWSFIKWILYVQEQKNIYIKAKRDFFNSHPRSSFDDWKEYVNGDHGYPRIEVNVPKASKHKEDICRWLFYWPFSMIVTLIKDFMRELFNFIYNKVKRLYQFVADEIYSDVRKDWE